MSEDKTNYRMERINRLLQELEYEMTRGMMEREIPEEIGLRFVVPVSQVWQGFAVLCEFRSRPVSVHSIAFNDGKPRFRIVK